MMSPEIKYIYQQVFKGRDFIKRFQDSAKQKANYYYWFSENGNVVAVSISKLKKIIG